MIAFFALLWDYVRLHFNSNERHYLGRTISMISNVSNSVILVQNSGSNDVKNNVTALKHPEESELMRIFETMTARQRCELMAIAFYFDDQNHKLPVGEKPQIPGMKK